MTSRTTSSTASSEQLGGAPLEVRVHRAAKRLRLRLDGRTGMLILTVPPRVSRRRALEWAAGHRDWVKESLERLPQRSALADGGTLTLFGRPHRIAWSPDEGRRVAVDGDAVRIGGPLEGLEPRLLRWLKEQARAILAAETEHFAQKAGVTVSRVGIGDASSRWASCSSSGAIRYSWRLVMAPDFVRRATVAHEVAHRVHMNHGQAFHALVEQLLEEDCKPAREWLRRHGAELHRVGTR